MTVAFLFDYATQSFVFDRSMPCKTNTVYKDEKDFQTKQIYRRLVVLFHASTCVWPSEGSIRLSSRKKVASSTALLLESAAGRQIDSLVDIAGFVPKNIYAVTRDREDAKLLVRKSKSNVICGELDSVWQDFDDIFSPDLQFDLVIDDRMGFVTRKRIAHLETYVAQRLSDKSVYSVTYCRRRHKDIHRRDLAAAICDAFRRGSGLETCQIISLDYSRRSSEFFGAPMSVFLFSLARRRDCSIARHLPLAPHKCLYGLSFAGHDDLSELDADFIHSLLVDTVKENANADCESQSDFLKRRFDIFARSSFACLKDESLKARLLQEAIHCAPFPIEWTVEDAFDDSLTFHIAYVGAVRSFFNVATIPNIARYLCASVKKTISFLSFFEDERFPNMTLNNETFIVLNRKQCEKN